MTPPCRAFRRERGRAAGEYCNREPAALQSAMATKSARIRSMLTRVTRALLRGSTSVDGVVKIQFLPSARLVLTAGLMLRTLPPAQRGCQAGSGFAFANG